MRAPVTRTALVALVLAVTLLVSRSASPAPPAHLPQLASLPFAFGPWQGTTAPPLDPEVEATLAADQYLRRHYGHTEVHPPSGPIEMDLAYYAQPRVGANMHSPLNCLPGNGWEVVEVRERTLSTTIGPVEIRELTVGREGERYALTYWFQNRHRIVADELSARLSLLGDAIRRRPADAGLARLILPIDGDGTDERDFLASFASSLIPEIDVRLR